MGFLARADKRAVSYGLVGSLLLSIGGAFWALPHIEDELDEESLSVASYAGAPGFVIEWNGRDGYLTVPAGTSQADTERVAADLADISGTRDVEIRFADSDAVVGDLDNDEGDDAAAGEAAATSPAFFGLAWGQAGRTGTGSVPAGQAERLAGAFDTQDWGNDTSLTLSPAAATTLESVIAPLVDKEIKSGTLKVAADEITITGVVEDEETRARLTSILEAEPSVSAVDLQVVDWTVADAAASFVVEWNAQGVTQTGTAPQALDEDITSLGVAEPALGSGLTVEDGVTDDLAALAPLITTSLVSGSATVTDGVLSISAFAASQDDLEAARDALSDGDADVTIEVAPAIEDPGDPDAAADARAALEALALSGIQFETNTSTLTVEAESIIDEVAGVLEANPAVAIEIIGHTDSRGDDAVNQALSEARAAAVLEGLAARGIDRQRLESSGRGESQPIGTNDTIAGQQGNRRVEIDIKETNG